MKTESLPEQSTSSGTSSRYAYLLGTAAVLGASWMMVRRKTAQIEREHPPTGDFITIDGVRLHYLSQGDGPVVVLLHGNGVTAEDFRNCGLFEQLARDHRVIAFDRPGFGYSERPRTTVWTPAAQARLLTAALQRLGVEQAVVLAHSWATLVALSMAKEAPQLVAGLVLASGYYYPSVRLDVLTSTPAIPIIGDLMRYTLSPLLGRLMWPLVVKRAFAPAPVPDSFRRMPPWMALRPDQLRAEAAETAMMIPSAAKLRAHYPELKMPVAIVSGDTDGIADAWHNSVHLNREIAGSELTLVPGAGHMIQHLAPEALMEAVRQVERDAGAGQWAQDGAALRPAAGAAPPLH
jgi:pimeloyl-ACP methyl ester carboxylesterase